MTMMQAARRMVFSPDFAWRLWHGRSMSTIRQLTGGHARFSHNSMTSAFLPGFLLGLSLILAIGAQNAFVLRQGLRREHVFAICLVCAGSDAVLIAGGVAGVGALV